MRLFKERRRLLNGLTALLGRFAVHDNRHFKRLFERLPVDGCMWKATGKSAESRDAAETGSRGSMDMERRSPAGRSMCVSVSIADGRSSTTGTLYSPASFFSPPSSSQLSFPLPMNAVDCGSSITGTLYSPASLFSPLACSCVSPYKHELEAFALRFADNGAEHVRELATAVDVALAFEMSNKEGRHLSAMQQAQEAQCLSSAASGSAGFLDVYPGLHPAGGLRQQSSPLWPADPDFLENSLPQQQAVHEELEQAGTQEFEKKVASAHPPPLSEGQSSLQVALPELDVASQKCGHRRDGLFRSGLDGNDIKGEITEQETETSLAAVLTRLFPRSFCLAILFIDASFRGSSSPLPMHHDPHVVQTKLRQECGICMQPGVVPAEQPASIGSLSCRLYAQWLQHLCRSEAGLGMCTGRHVPILVPDLIFTA
eukprot:scaffold29744_cov19-Tisochrysis_lutea.AAC.1